MRLGSRDPNFGMAPGERCHPQNLNGRTRSLVPWAIDEGESRVSLATSCGVNTSHSQVGSLGRGLQFALVGSRNPTFDMDSGKGGPPQNEKEGARSPQND